MRFRGRRAVRSLAAFALATVLLLVAGATPARADCTVEHCTFCIAGPTCTSCESGYALSVTNTCDDLNECATANGGCDPQALCTNTPGAFSCTCQAGWAGDGFACADVNECAVNNGGCDPLAPCLNNPGSYGCGSCPTGYAGTGSTGCTDVNECATGAACGVGTCINTAGAFGCDCPSGVTGDDCGVNGYVPPDRATAKCANAIASKIGSYVKCVLQCRTRKASKELAGKSYDEQACTSACRAAFDGKVAQLKTRGLCPACLDETAQNLLAEDARLYSMDVKGHGYCQGTEPLAP